MHRFRWAMKASRRDGAERRKESGRRGALLLLLLLGGEAEEEESADVVGGGGIEDGMGAPDGRSATGTSVGASAADMLGW